MLIQAIHTRNFLGLPFTQITLEQPVLLVCGPNGSGKSTLHDAVRYALLGEPARRVKLKGEYELLLSEGAKDGSVKVVFGNSISVERGLPKDTLTVDGAVTWDPGAYPSLPFILDAHRFGALSDKERRAFITDLVGATWSFEDVAKRLAAGKVPDNVIVALAAMLGSGFDAAQKYAELQASEARGAWVSITGEPRYGDVKAKDWAPTDTPEPVSDEQIRLAADAVTDADAELAKVNQGVGRNAAVDRAPLQRQADALAERKERLARGNERLTELTATIETLQAAARDAEGVLFPCPCCEARLVYDRGIVRKAPEGDQSAPEAFAALQAAEKDLREVERGITELNRRISESEGAVAMLAALPPVDDTAGGEDPEAQAKAVADAQQAVMDARQALARLKQQRADYAAHETKAERAAAAHARVQGWKLAAQQLAPDGIPSVLLASALDPINKVLRKQSDASGWAQVQIGRDFGIRYGQRVYQLCSESEQWRANAMLSAAIAELSELPLVMLDRIDVLEVAARQPAMDWLRGLGAAGVTVIVTGTLKEPPTFPGVQTVWLGDAPAQAA